MGPHRARDFHDKPKGLRSTFTAKADAERAVKEVNMTGIAGRPVAVDWALSKTKYAEARKLRRGRHRVRRGSEDDDVDPDEMDVDSEDGSDVDSEDVDEEMDEEMDDDEETDDDDDDDDDRDEEEDADDMMRRVMNRVMDNPDAEENPAEASGTKVKHANRREAREAARAERIAKAREAAGKRDAKKGAPARKFRLGLRLGLDGDDNDDDEDDEPPPRFAKKTDAAAEGCSVFIRDVPTECSKQMLFERMSKFGKVRSCRMVMDKASGRPKGTAFVDFVNGRGKDAVEAAGKVEGGGVKVAGRR